MALSHVMNVISNAGIVGAGTGSGGGGGSGAIMGAEMTAGYTSGYGFQSSGYYDYTVSGSTLGTATNNTLLGTVLGVGGLVCKGVWTTNAAMYITFEKPGYTGSFVNTGWTSINIYLDQSNNTGSPDLTLARTALNYSTSGGSVTTATYTSYGSYSISTYFGTLGQLKYYFVEIL
mgnify:FL=1